MDIRSITFLFNCFFTFEIIYCETLDEEHNIQLSCRDKNRLIGTNDSDAYSLVDVVANSTVVLECNYCTENDDHEPKIWYKIDRYFISNVTEVDLDMETNLTINRIHTTINHELIIRNISFDDTGIYFCHGKNGQDSQYKFNYLVDLINENITTPITGNITEWQKYKHDYLEPINNLFLNSNSTGLLNIRDNLNITMELVSEWKRWSRCEVCGRPLGQAIRKKTGKCRLKLNYNKQENKYNNNITNETERLANNFLLNSYKISCYSIALDNLLPFISMRTCLIPDFIQTEHCEGICNPDAEGNSKGWKTGKTKAFKYRKTYVLAQNAHLTVVCPEASVNTKVVWKKDGLILPSGHSVDPGEGKEPRIVVDTFSTLYLVGVTSTEEGNYTCFVDDTRMQQTQVFVVSKTYILTQAFLRHMIYLGFVLSLTLSCYCAGLIVACKRRHTFKKYTPVQQEEEE